MSSPATLPTRLDPPPITGNTSDQEFLEQMAGPNATPDQVEAIGRAWHVAQADIDAITKLPASTDQDEHLNREARTAITAAMCEAAINQKGLVVTSAIQVATN